MNSLLRRLATASMTGAALAALATGCTTTTASVAEDDGDTGGGENGETLDPYPESALGCSGEDHMGPPPGYWGQCCTDLVCFTPDDGVCETDLFELEWRLGPGPDTPGECGCAPESTGLPVAGPFGPHEADMGSCCYIVGTIACDGRPLLVEGAARVARIQQRLDWLA